MIRLKDIIIEGLFTNPDDRANHIANHIFGSEYTLTNKQPNPQDSREITYTFSSGSDTQVIARTVNSGGNIVWYLKKNDGWEKISVKSIPRPPPTPEELKIQSDRQLRQSQREKVRREREAAYEREREAEERAFNAKFPNFETDSKSGTGNSELDFYIQNSGLTDREQIIIRLYYKGYTLTEMEEIFNVGRGRISYFLKKAIVKIQQNRKNLK